MRSTLTILLWAACCATSFAQAYDSALTYRLSSPTLYEAMDHFVAAAASDPSDTGEEKRSEVLERRKVFMGGRASFDVSLGADMFAPAAVGLVSYMAYYNDYCPGSGFTGNWTCMGPFPDFYSDYEQNGRVDAIWVHPTDTAHILLGGNGGGLWKSNNGGRSWRCLTDAVIGTASSVLGMAGVHSIAVNPADTNIIYIAQGGRDQSKKTFAYGIGLVYTTNGGASWHSDASFNVMVSFPDPPVVTKIAYMPGTQKLFAISKTKVLYKPSPSDPWEDITPTGFSPSGDRWCFDMDFTHSPSGKLVVSFGSLSNTCHLCTYDPSTDTWSYMPITLSGGYTLPDYHFGAIRFSLSSSDDAFMQVRAMNGSAKASLLIKTPITTYSQDVRNSNFTDQLTGASMYQLHDMKVSPANADIIYCANYSNPAPIMISTNGGTTFSAAGGLGHADGNAIFIHSATNTSNGINDVVYVGNDGGIRKKRYGTLNFAGITGTGLCLKQFFGFGGTEATDGIMMAGAQDVGTWAYRRSASVPWTRTEGADGYTAKVARNGINKAIGEINCGSSCSLHNMFGRDLSGLGTFIPSITISTPVDMSISNINRPLFFDAQNTAHVGYSMIWKKPFNPGTGDWDFATANWQRAFDRDPINYTATAAYPQIATDFYIDENNTDNVYIAYRDPAGEGNDYTSAQYGKLFFSSNANDVAPTPPTWTNITPAICTTHQINTIMVDPQNTARIWIGFGNISSGLVGAPPASMVNRVYYSSNNGATWSDASKGLPALPVNKLVYRKGTDDEMYAGTDVGVFKWNKAAAQWECFSNGLPPCTVMDMEINYCAGKLRICTFGRGIWETPLPSIDPANEEPIEITAGTTTWSTERWLQSGVRVKAGGVLKITGTTIHMPADRLIIVEQGGKLEVQSSTLTNSCENCMWGGIQAWGSVGPQTAATKGWVTIRNSTIEHAVIGVCNYKLHTAPAWYEAGGVIQALGSTFRNNRTSAVFQEYHNGTATGVIPDLSYFQSCTFKNESGFKYVPYAPVPTTLVSMCGVEGVRFSGCLFAENRTVWGGFVDGIQAVNASFIVQPYFPPTLIPRRSRFHGLRNGILTREAGIDVMHAGVATVDQADFDTTTVGVNVIGQDMASVTRCQFFIGRGVNAPFMENSAGVPFSCGMNIGVLTQAAKIFKIEGNIFSGVSNTFGISPWHNIGVLTVHAGNATNRIYRNSFDHLTHGTMGLGDYSPHHPALPGYGLQVSCNSFASNTNDIYSGGSIASHGIAADQFMPNIYGTMSSASNSFSGSTKNFVNINPTRTIVYRDYTGSMSTSGLALIYMSSLGDCKTTIPPGYSGGSTTLPGYMTATATSLDASSLAAYKSAFYAAKAAHATASANYEAAIDAGNTDSVITVIDTSGNMQMLFQSLTSMSPFLSQAALMEAAIVTGQNNYQDVIDLLEQNPEAIFDYQYLNDVADVLGMTTQDFDALWAVACSTQTQRSTMEQNIAVARAEMYDNAAMVLFALRSPSDTNVSVTDTTYAGVCTDSTSIYYLLDSSSVYHNLDTLDVWLQNIGGLKEAYERVGLKYFRGQYQDANSLFSSIGSMSMTPAELNEHAIFDTVWGVLYSAALNGRGLFGLNTADITSLGTVSELTPLLAARAVRLKNNIAVTAPVTYQPCAPMAPAAKPIKRKIRKTRSSIGEYQVRAYPNPASGEVSFAYHRPDAFSNSETVTITISNISGATVAELKGPGDSGEVKWQPSSGIASGVYIYQVSDTKGVFGKGKLVLIK